ATGYLDPASISYPFRMLFRKTGINFRMAELKFVDTERQLLHLNTGELAYDYLVFAAGTKTNFFGHTNIVDKSISLKGIDDAINMRNALIATMEKAVLEQDPIIRKALLTTVVVGGGATGVEVAGVLAEMRKYILLKDYPELRHT